MPTKNDKGATKEDLQKLVEDLGHQPGKSAVRAAAGKEPAKPNPGRLDKNGETNTRRIDIGEVPFKRLTIHVVGKPESALILHNWGRKAIFEMLGNQMGISKDVLQGDKDAFSDFVGALYSDRHTGELTIRSIMFKAAMLDAIRWVKNVRYVDAMQAISILGEHSPLWGFPINRMDPVRVGPWNERVADLRFRPEFPSWMAELTFEYNPDRITPAAIAHLLNAAGTAPGVGEWRPERKGVNGTFEVVTSKHGPLDALKKRLGRHKVAELTPENTGTIDLLASYGLDPKSVALLKAQKPTSPGPETAGSNGKAIA